MVTNSTQVQVTTDIARAMREVRPLLQEAQI